MTFDIGSIQLSFRSPNTCKVAFNPNVTTFQSNCAGGLHFSAFHYELQLVSRYAKYLHALINIP